MTTEEKLKEMLGDYYEMGVPGSPNAAILQNMLGADNELRDPQSENEALLKLIYEGGQLINQEAIERCEAAQEVCEQTAAAVQSHTAALYDSTKTYAVGEYVVYDGALYVCTTAVTTAEEWDAAHWTETTVGEALTSLQNEVDEAERQIDAVSIKDTASGSIASFSDGADGMPLKSLVIDIEPVQDLHGYDNPWPAGGGINIADISDVSIPTGQDNYATLVSAMTLPAGTYTLSWTLSTNVTATRNRPYHCIAGTSQDIVYMDGDDTTAGRESWTFTLAEEKTVDIRWWYHTVSPACTLSKIMLERGSTAHDYQPYSNLCPISGHTGANVSACGVNVWDEEWEVGAINADTGENQDGAVSIRTKNYIRVEPGAQYFAYIGGQSGGTNLKTRWYGKNKEYIGSSPSITYGSVFTVPAGAYYLRFLPQNAYGITYNNDISINYPSTDHDYHAYTGQTKSISFGSTIYGGTDEVVSGSGKSTMAMVDLGTLEWNYNPNWNGAGAFYLSSAPSGILLPVDKYHVIGAISSIYKEVSRDYLYTHNETGFCVPTDGKISIRDGRYTDAASFAVAVAGKKLVYPLATPTDFSTTPVTDLVSLKGDNNVWNNCNGDTTVEYVADPKLYINKIVAALA